MDATVRRSSRRVHTLITLTVLACISFLAVFSGNSGARAIVLHDRRDIFIRQNAPRPSTSITTTETGSSGPSVTLSGSSISSQSNMTISSSTTSSTQSTTSISSTSTTHSPVVSQPTSSSTSQITSQTSIESTTTPSPITSSTTQLTISTTSIIRSTTSSSIPVPIVSSLSETINPQPATTISIATNVLQTPVITTTTPLPQPPSDASSTLPNTSSAALAAAKSSGFWQNKAAVAATFVIVSLVLLAIAAVVVISYLKRRSARRQDLIHEELFEKFSDSGHRSNSPGPSINAAPMEAFSSRDVTYDLNPFHNYGGVEYQRAVPSAIPVQHPDYYNQSTNTASARYISPSDAQAARKATVPTPSRNPVGRTPVARGSYQQSIDSFYGGIAGQPSSSGYAM